MTSWGEFSYDNDLDAEAMQEAAEDERRARGRRLVEAWRELAETGFRFGDDEDDTEVEDEA